MVKIEIRKACVCEYHFCTVPCRKYCGIIISYFHFPSWPINTLTHTHAHTKNAQSTTHSLSFSLSILYYCTMRDVRAHTQCASAASSIRGGSSLSLYLPTASAAAHRFALTLRRLLALRQLLLQLTAATAAAVLRLLIVAARRRIVLVVVVVTVVIAAAAVAVRTRCGHAHHAAVAMLMVVLLVLLLMLTGGAADAAVAPMVRRGMLLLLLLVAAGRAAFRCVCRAVHARAGHRRGAIVQATGSRVDGRRLMFDVWHMGCGTRLGLRGGNAN